MKNCVIYKTIKYICVHAHTITQGHTAVCDMWHGVLRCTNISVHRRVEKAEKHRLIR
jgi:hypothetical protein